jgi:hypothetical protein
VTRWPIYIPSRGRHDICVTTKALIAEGVPFHVVVEPHEAVAYQQHFQSVLVMDESHRGVAYARTWMKNHAHRNGHLYHWQIDDNIRGVYVRNGTRNERTTYTNILGCAERYVDRFTNIGQASFIYRSFAFAATREVEINRLCASCMLIRNDLPIHFRPDLISDTDFSLQLLHLGFCTVVFQDMMIDKIESCVMKGGCTEIQHSRREHYYLGLTRAWPGVFRLRYRKGRIGMMPSSIWRSFPQRPVPKGEL